MSVVLRRTHQSCDALAPWRTKVATDTPKSGWIARGAPMPGRPAAQTFLPRLSTPSSLKRIQQNSLFPAIDNRNCLACNPKLARILSILGPTPSRGPPTTHILRLNRTNCLFAYPHPGTDPEPGTTNNAHPATEQNPDPGAEQNNMHYSQGNMLTQMPVQAQHEARLSDENHNIMHCSQGNA
jgi:hypothetical protein